jgi:hypothetical protein
MAWEEDLGPSPLLVFRDGHWVIGRKATFDTEESDGHAGS